MATKIPKEPKRHHTVPKVYLENFTDENGQCWVLKDTLKYFHNIPANILNRKDFNTITLKNGEKSYVIEKEYLRTLEGHFGTVVKKIIRHEELSLLEKEIMSCFVVSMLARTENRRLAMGDFLEQLSDHEKAFQELNDSEKKQMSELSSFFSDEQKDRSVPMSDVLKIREDMSSHQAMSIPNTVNATYGYVYSMNWVFLVSKGREFFTSDDPVSLFNANLLLKDGSYGVYHPGLAQKAIEVSFPITKNISLMATYDERPDMKYLPVNDEVVRALNERQTMYARQVVFSNEKDLLKRLDFAIQYSVRNVLVIPPEVQ